MCLPLLPWCDDEEPCRFFPRCASFLSFSSIFRQNLARISGFLTASPKTLSCSSKYITDASPRQSTPLLMRRTIHGPTRAEAAECKNKKQTNKIPNKILDQKAYHNHSLGDKPCFPTWSRQLSIIFEIYKLPFFMLT